MDAKNSAIALVLASSLVACAPSHVTTNSPRTAVHQLLGSEAIDRSLAGLAWPNDLAGRRVVVKAVSTAEAIDERYLLARATTEVIGRGGRVTTDEKTAEREVTVLAGSVGTTESKSFVGLPETSSALVPIGTPEISLYKSVYQRGFAKVELLVRDLGSGDVTHHAGPNQAITYWHEFDVLLFGFQRTNTSWNEEAEAVGTDGAAQGPAPVVPAASPRCRGVTPYPGAGCPG